ncbi:Uncharacterized protein BP5553_09595 [Venustampulla echinocandica]|uniref:Uncharacterized protein n=1 Tax=Venustampulla echinocandica TaxID=2656787 RepID=A0A370TBH6_9HELO|nr:Uncharacterized protein BP5553_09595 [Venustampulla echinocandica]RDL31386.1 Uncharacterized protein BP5553_09595 [Venustampulla echinocandica]
MDDTPITGLEELETHLQLLVSEPDTPLNAKLFDEVELQLNDGNISPLIPRLLPTLTQILLAYPNDPSILTSLAIKLLRPVTFAQALTMASEEALIRALQSPAPSANLLAITVLQKAARSPSDTAILSVMKGLVEAFFRTWLSTPHVEVGETATQTLGDLLEVDCDNRSSASIDTKMRGMQLSSGMPPGQGLLWRRIFQDREVYESIFSLCSFQTLGTGHGHLDERQKSLAQGRLLRIIPRLAALDFHAITHTHFPDVDQRFGLQYGEQGLLYFAMVDMVSKQDDVLMHTTLVYMFIEFLEVMSITELTQPTVEYLAGLVRKVAAADEALYKSLGSIALNPETPPEFVDLYPVIPSREVYGFKMQVDPSVGLQPANSLDKLA